MVSYQSIPRTTLTTSKLNWLKKRALVMHAHYWHHLFCRYKCHRGCAAKAPPSCGLPQELMNYFRKHMAITSSMERLADQRVDSTAQSPSERSTPRPPMERSNTYDLDTRNSMDTRDPEFLIQDLASEPTNCEWGEGGGREGSPLQSRGWEMCLTPYSLSPPSSP